MTRLTVALLLLAVAPSSQAFFCFNFGFGAAGSGADRYRGAYYPPPPWIPASIPMAPPAGAAPPGLKALPAIAPAAERHDPVAGDWQFRPLK